ncbi:MAG: hypothetical protein NT107_09825 [Planctomycetota bacterium]|nr:hypothetical protein [Planctomycetota bacterium]
MQNPLATIRSNPFAWRKPAQVGGLLLIFAILTFLVFHQQIHGPESLGAADQSPLTNTHSEPATATTNLDETNSLQVRETIPSEALATPRARTFTEFIEQLVQLGMEVSDKDTAGDKVAAKDADLRARQTFSELIEQVVDPENCALTAILGTEPPAKSDLTGQLRRQAWNLVLSVGLNRQNQIAMQYPDRAGVLAALVSGILTALPASDALAAELGTGQLASRPFLALEHEPQVLELVVLAGEQHFPVAVAEALLTTLWRNLQANGDRTSTELAGLALLLLQEGNEAERRAARRRLLLDDRYRYVLLQHLRETKDRAEAMNLAIAAAELLPASSALEVLSTAVAIGSEPATAFLLLGQRSPGAIQQAYEQQLASNSDPKFRDMLVAGAGFSNEPSGLEVAKLALASDPDPGVRQRAIFALAAKAPGSLGEAAIQRAIDDPAFANNTQRLHSMVLALESLANAGEQNAVDRLGQRMRIMSGLSAAARIDLERILARTLPNGQTSR